MSFLARILRHTDLLVGAGLLVIVSMLILPLPEWALDLGLVVAIASSVVILLTSVNVKEPLQFSVFPSLLLVTTLYRLALSIAATKLILGTGHAGHVIQTFGEFVLGGNFVVGFVSFVILMIVQFIVITQGATRVSEVVARFTLDAMPGKQMAIDADLASGTIDEAQARERRRAVKAEADFYGSMDGASKFVKGDAIASTLIIIVNIIGGFVVGFMRGEGDPMTILGTYAMLSVGEGLVSQIPALLISTASGLLVTRNGQESGMGGTLVGQLLDQPKVLLSTAGALTAFAFIPGFPSAIFLGVAAAAFGASRFAQRNPELGRNLARPPEPAQAPKAEPAAPTGPETVLPLVSVEALEIEVGYALTRLADSRLGGDLPDRIAATRRQMATELGFVMPSVRIRDNALLAPKEYAIKIRGEEIARSVAEPDMLLAIGGESAGSPLHGIPAKEPVFNLDAVWIDPGLRAHAEANGYTVVEPGAMIATHLGEIVKTNAPELLSRQDVNTLIENAKQQNETVVGELIPNVVQVGDVQKVLQHLLRERVPIRDLVTILETMADYGSRVKDNEQLGELVRSALARTITRQYSDDSGRLNCITLEPMLERQVQDALQQTAGGVNLALDLGLQQSLLEDLRSNFERLAMGGSTPILLTSATVRLALRKLMERHLPQLAVVAYNEVAASAEVEFVGQISSPALAA
ncbi:MAG: flagellar biosynthesis protein FlhA [Fimbriimonadaceae bacterium]|nr:flagellar biosynthesis protein FlhA [Fimbriimonadaceae bacterium]QYK54756.1 MAG: flagellar biosynthesis protein FlhA [Fimbriimonadaceae bacterium]